MISTKIEIDMKLQVAPAQIVVKGDISESSRRRSGTVASFPSLRLNVVAEFHP